MKPVAFLFLLIVSASRLTAQSLDESALLKILSNRNEVKMAANDSLLIAYYEHADSVTRVSLLDLLDKQTASHDLYTAARSLAWKGIVLHRKPFNRGDAAVYIQQSISKAVESGDEYLMVQCFEVYGYHCKGTGKPETSLFYFLKSAELRKKLGDQYFFAKNMELFSVLGDLLFNMQEYEQSVQYIQLTNSLVPPGKTVFAGSLNTLGLDYQRMKKYDSALYCFNQGLASARITGDSLWVGIVKGNIGAVYFELGQDDKALPLLWSDYYTCQETEKNNAGNTLHRIALISLRQNKTDSALLLARKAFQLVSSGLPYNAAYAQNANFALAEVFKKTGKTDSAFFYSDKYHSIKDSIDQSIARNRADIVQTRLDFEKTSNRINTLLDEKKAEKLKRNLLLGGLFLLLAAGWFYIRWQRQRYLARQASLLFEKEKAESEIQFARLQLEEFTQHSIEKNELIEKLQGQLQQQNRQANDELVNQSILTENDWLRFRDMFDKAHPGFIARLRSLSPDITTAEIRLAALIRLNLGNKHIASMLGIGADAVRKTKSRLRQRLGLTPEAELEDFIKNIQLGSGGDKLS
ncbi:MAG: tetratricopeptide repeat protein [Chitinophagaceae bacterium]|nr:tetratricopeptide repeat protein [Chitinophagaceae bacterium]